MKVYLCHLQNVILSRLKKCPNDHCQNLWWKQVSILGLYLHDMISQLHTKLHLVSHFDYRKVRKPLSEIFIVYMFVFFTQMLQKPRKVKELLLHI